MSVGGRQINPIDVKYHLQKSLEIFAKNSADKIQFKNYKEVNPPCLMPIRVNTLKNLTVPSKWMGLENFVKMVNCETKI